MKRKVVNIDNQTVPKNSSPYIQCNLPAHSGLGCFSAAKSSGEPQREIKSWPSPGPHMIL